MAIDISERILKEFHSFSKGQKRIANAILNSYDKTAYMTAARLGRSVGVSESTVVRFAGVLGYDGYSAMQKAIQELVRIKSTPNQRIEITKQRIGRRDVIENVMDSDIRKIRYSLENLNRDTFNSAVSSILSAKTIYVTGARSAEPIAKILHYNLSLIFDNVKFVTSNSIAEIFEQILSISEEDVLIAFSFPRYSSKMINAVKFAKSNGATVIGFTDSAVSPIAEHSTYLLPTQSDMASFMDSLVAPICIINSIIVEITRRREREITKRFEKLEQIWDEYDVYTKR